MKLEFSLLIFETYSNIKLHGNPYSGSRVVPRGRADGRADRRTDMIKLILINDQLDAKFLFLYVYFRSLLVSS
jgi:hypothetical protein